MTTNQKGAVAELAIALEASRLGIGVLRPLVEGVRYDLVFDWGNRLERVQCKWAHRRGDVIGVQTGGNYHSPTKGYVRSTYGVGEVEAIAAYCPEIGACYYLPIDQVAGLTYIHLRLRPARNSQRAGIRMATDFEFGAVAQLEVAPPWHGGGRGFESHQLHSPQEGVTTVGANLFRDHFGWYMERAGAGEEIVVTRRGKPTVRLIAVNPQPSLATGSDGAGGETAMPPASEEA
jgi:prevent-host-death family protein